MEKKYKYNAFISYRHLNPDKDIAARLQKKLESYRPPKSLTVGKRFEKWRIFRDETELPTSSNLSNDIKKALEDSEYLIVICSEATKESRWCTEEIEYFKKLHDGSNSHIITLIAKGDPSEVFPPSLCSELIPVTDENGNTVYRSHIIEPLAANVSGKNLAESMRKLNTEFLRIAAPLLGCGYDNLYNREQKKKTRMILTACGIVLLFVLLFAIYNGAMLSKINAQKNALAVANDELLQKTAEAEENMQTALENEAKAKEAGRDLRIKNSEILADRALIYLENDDIYSAAKTALEALPTEGEDIPNNPVAEYVISSAFNAYDCTEKMINTKVNLSGYVEFLQFSEDGTRLLAEDTTGTVHIIDYDKSEVIASYTVMDIFGEPGFHYGDIVVDGNDGYVLCNGRLVAIDLEDGSIKWQYNGMEHDIFASSDSIVTNPEASCLFLPDSSDYVLLSKDGEILLCGKREEEAVYSYKDYVHMGNDGTVYIIRPEKTDIHVITKDKQISYPIEIGKTDGIQFAEDDEDRLYINTICGYNDDIPKLTNGRMICVNKEDMSLKWTSDYKTEAEYIGKYNTMFEFTHSIPDASGEFKKHDGILTVIGGNILCFDREDGRLCFKTTEEKNGDILYCAPNTTEYSIRIGTSKEFVTKAYLANRYNSASQTIGESGDSVMYSRYYTLDKERKFAAYAPENKFAFADAKSPEIDIYHAVSFNNHTAFSDYPVNASNCSATSDDGNGTFAVYYYNYVDDVKERHIAIYDAKNDVCRAYFGYDTDVDCMVFKNEKLLIIDSNFNCKVTDYSGNILEEFSLKERISDAAGLEKDAFISLYDERIYHTKDNIVFCIPAGIFTINLSGDKAVFNKALYGSGFSEYYISGNFVSFTQDSYAKNCTKIAYFLNGDTQFTYMKDNGNEAEFIMDSVYSVVNTSVGNKIAFISKEGYIGISSYGSDSIMRIQLPHGKVDPLKISFTPDGASLIAMCPNGSFIKYSADTGEVQGEYNAEFEVATYTEFVFMDDNTFYIKENSYKNNIYIVDINSMEKVAVVRDFLRYLSTERMLIYRRYLSDDDRYELGYFKYLTTQELSTFAKEILNAR